MEGEVCPLCYRTVRKTGDGKYIKHEHTPLLGEVCSGSGKTRAEAVIHKDKMLQEYRDRKKKGKS